MDSFNEQDLDIQLTMNNGARVQAKLHHTDEVKLVFSPPCAGDAVLSIKVDNEHIKNSPYSLRVRKLSLDENDDLETKSRHGHGQHKSVKFQVEYFKV